MKRLIGLTLIVLAFVLPFVVIPHLPTVMLEQIAFHSGMGINPVSTLCIVAMVFGFGMWEGHV
jgi:hypothetical protein